MKVVAIIQARTGSTRMPGKVFLDLAGEPVLARMVSRAERASTVDQVVIATTDASSDDQVADFCEARGIPYFRGSEDDVLDRYYQAAKAFKADIVVRLTADCPLIDPHVVDLVVGQSLQQATPADYACNVVIEERTFPRGLDTEVLSFDALERVWEQDTNPEWREHVTLYIRYNPAEFRVLNIRNDVDYSHMRWTLDTPDDYTFIRTIYNHYGHDRFSWQEVVALLEEHPEWMAINQHVEQKPI